MHLYMSGNYKTNQNFWNTPIALSKKFLTYTNYSCESFRVLYSDLPNKGTGASVKQLVPFCTDQDATLQYIMMAISEYTFCNLFTSLLSLECASNTKGLPKAR